MKQDRPIIEYPCIWEYKLIGTNEQLLHAIAQETCKPGVPTIAPSRTSSSGKYCSLTVTIEVEDEARRNELFALFQNNPDIKMVI